MTTLQNIPFMIQAVPIMMVNILFLLSPFVFIISTIALIKMRLVKNKRNEKDKREVLEYTLISVVSGVMFLIMYLYFQTHPLIF